MISKFCKSIAKTIFSHRRSEQFWKQNTKNYLLRPSSDLSLKTVVGGLSFEPCFNSGPYSCTSFFWSINSCKLKFVSLLYIKFIILPRKPGKEYLPNLLETWLLPQFFVFRVRDFKFWLIAYFLISFKCAKFHKYWTTLI